MKRARGLFLGRLAAADVPCRRSTHQQASRLSVPFDGIQGLLVRLRPLKSLIGSNKLKGQLERASDLIREQEDMGPGAPTAVTRRVQRIQWSQVFQANPSRDTDKQVV